MSTTTIPPKGKGLEYDGAIFFNALSPEHQERVLSVYQVKHAQGELDDIVGEAVSKIERVARQYQAQLDAFEDVLTTKGFEICKDAPRDYDGRIAVLSMNGTLIMLGKPRTDGRHIYMSRIHSPKLNCSGSRGYLGCDLEIGKSPMLTHISHYGRNYHGSNTQGLAINPRGADGDELVEAETISTTIANKTSMLLNDPAYKPKPVVLKPGKI
jgi:hypothetical protein